MRPSLSRKLSEAAALPVERIPPSSRTRIMNMLLRSLLVSAAILALPSLAAAQGAGHSGHSMPMQTERSTDTPATKEYREANAKMHRDMDIPYTGDSDIDFVLGMIPHHQGAIDMAKVAL